MSNTFGSLFAGVGGFDLGMEAAGWQCGFQVEWDSACQQVLAHHWPDVPRWGDVSEVNGADLPPVDCITFGSPCQDLSIAGQRAGLEGNRSGLFHEAVRIIKEMRDATSNEFPRWGIWENVPGALSSNGGADFRTVLEEMGNLGAHFVEWHILDARWFGVPQRRRRVFVIACFDSGTAARCPDPLLPVPARSGWNPPSGDTPQQEVAGTLGGGSGNRGWSPDTDRMTFIPAVVPEPSGTLMRMLAFGKYTDDGTASAIKQRDYKDATDLVVPAAYVKVVRPQSDQHPEVWREEPVAPTLNRFDQGDSRATTAIVQAIGFSHTQGLDAQPSEEAFPTLRAEGGGHAVSVTGIGVRRLITLECERLQGWPDDHTRWRADGKEQSDSARYRQIGNGVASPVAAWIGKHLRAVDG